MIAFTKRDAAAPPDRQRGTGVILTLAPHSAQHRHDGVLARRQGGYKANDAVRVFSAGGDHYVIPGTGRVVVNADVHRVEGGLQANVRGNDLCSYSRGQAEHAEKRGRKKKQRSCAEAPGSWQSRT
jgi:hypothetical protein